MASTRASTSAMRLASGVSHLSSSSALRLPSKSQSSAKGLIASNSTRHQSTYAQSPDIPLQSESLQDAPMAASPDVSVSTDQDAPIRRPRYRDHTPSDPMYTKQERRKVWKDTLGHLNTLGSEQNRNTVWRPSHTRNKPLTSRQVTVSHLMAATAQVGHSMASASPAFQPWIYGTRHGVAQIDVENATMPALRRAAKVVQETVLRDGVVLFIGTTRDTQRAVVQAANRLGGNGYHVTTQRWLAGSLTNAPVLLQNAVMASAHDYTKQWEQHKANSGVDLDQINGIPNSTVFASKILRPDLVILLNTKENRFAAKEATLMNIPTIGIVDTDVDPRLVTYPIPANDESVRVQELIVGVLSKAGEEGHRQRKQLLSAKGRVDAAKREQYRLDSLAAEESRSSANSEEDDEDWYG